MNEEDLMATANASLHPASRRSGLLDGAVLLTVWAALWTFFALGVLEPAARLEAHRPAAVRPV
jgi:hypothetical protein